MPLIPELVKFVYLTKKAASEILEICLFFVGFGKAGLETFRFPVHNSAGAPAKKTRKAKIFFAKGLDKFAALWYDIWVPDEGDLCGVSSAG